jgi:hypothetical protein
MHIKRFLKILFIPVYSFKTVLLLIHHDINKYLGPLILFQEVNLGIKEIKFNSFIKYANNK